MVSSIDEKYNFDLIKVKCFCNDGHNGNVAGVILNCDLDDTEKQKLASKLKLPVIVFVKNENGKNKIRFFYPSYETNLCVHGALGAAKVILDSSDYENKLEMCFYNNDNYKIIITKTHGMYSLLSYPKEVPNIRVSNQEISSMLNLSDIDVIDANFPCTIFSVGSTKLFIPIKTLEDLLLLKPDFALIELWSKTNKVNGLYVYTCLGKDDYGALLLNARSFNPNSGQNEDNATGIAAAALSGLLKQDLIIKQGNDISNFSCLNVSYETNKILVGGQVL